MLLIIGLTMVVVVLVMIGMYQKPKALRREHDLMRLSLKRANEKKI